MEQEPIPRVTKGGTPTLLEADFANQLIDRVNEGSGAGFGKVTPPLKKVEDSEDRDWETLGIGSCSISS